MSKEVNLSSTGKPKSERLTVNLTNTTTGEVRKLEYDIAKLSGRAAMEAQMNLAEFAKDIDRDKIVGSLVFKNVLAGTTPVGDSPDLLAILDEIESEQLGALLEAVMEVATGSTVTS